MTIYQYVFVAGFLVFLFSSIFKIFKIISAGTRDDPSQPIGKIGPAIIYSFTGAMSPSERKNLLTCTCPHILRESFFMWEHLWFSSGLLYDFLIFLFIPYFNTHSLYFCSSPVLVDYPSS